MSSIDDIIRERLEKLRADDRRDTTLPSCSAKGNPLPKEKKTTAAEQVEDLLAQLSAEKNLETKVKNSEADPDAKIRSRLERLKSREGCNFSSGTSAPLPATVKVNEDIHDEEFFRKSSCTELLTLGHYTDCHYIDSDESLESDTSDSEDLEKLCVICDDSPAFMCLHCDKDLYCKKCFKEYHSPELRKRAVPFRH